LLPDSPRSCIFIVVASPSTLTGAVAIEPDVGQQAVIHFPEDFRLPDP